MRAGAQSATEEERIHLIGVNWLVPAQALDEYLIVQSRIPRQIEYGVSRWSR
jgi:hypothetical protein